MSLKLKILLGLLGAAAVFNAAADLWFRVAISGATGAPWYVWAPVGLTVVALISAGLGALLRKRLVSADDGPDAQGMVMPLFVAMIVDWPRDTDVADALAVLAKVSPGAWKPTGFSTTELQGDGGWLHRIEFTGGRAAPAAPVVTTDAPRVGAP